VYKQKHIPSVGSTWEAEAKPYDSLIRASAGGIMGKPENLESVEEILEGIEDEIIADTANKMMELLRNVPPELRGLVLDLVVQMAREP
jgi:hypothetical protein